MRVSSDTCGIEAVMDLVGGKWKPSILCALEQRPHRFDELPPRVEYSLTADGAELLEAFAPVGAWAAARMQRREIAAAAAAASRAA